MKKNAFYFILKALFVLKIFNKVNFEIYDVTAWLARNYNTHIAQYLTNKRQPDIEIWSVNRASQDNYFL